VLLDASCSLDDMQELVHSQHNRPQTILSIHQISRKLGISHVTVTCIIHDDLSLICLKKKWAMKLTVADLY